MQLGSILCFLRLHKWHGRRTDTGTYMFRCLRCGKENEKLRIERVPPGGGWDA